MKTREQQRWNARTAEAFLARAKMATVATLAIIAMTLAGCNGALTPDVDLPDSPSDGGTTGPPSMYAYGGTVTVDSAELSGTESFSARMVGNNAGTLELDTSRSYAARASLSPASAVLDVPDLLRRYPDVEFVSNTSYGFSEFLLVADVFLKPDTFVGPHWNTGSMLLSWGGGSQDLSDYIDLVSGEFVSTSSPGTIYQMRYDSVLLQINAPAQTIIPDFGTDTYAQTSFSWTDVKPFFSTNSSAQHIVYSTFVETPFVKWLGVKSDGFDAAVTVSEYYQRQVDAEVADPRALSDLEDWAFNAPINQEFFDHVASLDFTEDPNSGEAWVFMPLNQPIDLTGMDRASFSMELYMKHLFEVFIDADGEEYFVLGASRNFRNELGEHFYGPLPIRFDYRENPNGYEVTAVP